MARQETQSNELTAGGLAVGVPTTPAQSAANDWLLPAVFSIGGVAAIAVVVVALGAYFMPNAPNIPTVVAGVIILLLAAVAWITAMGFLLFGLVRQWFTGGGAANRPG